MQMIEVERPRSWQGRIPYRLLSLLVSGVLLAAGVAIVYHRLDWHNVAAVWTKLDPKLVALAVLAYWLQYPINSYRLHRVLVWVTQLPLSEVPPVRLLFKLTCSAGFVAVAAPIGLAGDAAKIAGLRMFGNLSITDAARGALFDRVVGVQWICIIGLATLPMQAVAGVQQATLLIELALFTGLVAAVGVLLVLPKALYLFRRQFINKLARVFEGYVTILSVRRSGIQIVFALLNLVSSWATLCLLLQAAGLSTNIWLVAGFVPLLQLVNSLPFLYMGWGGREIAMAATLGAAGNLTVNEALAVSIAWGAVMIMSAAVNGVFLLGDWQIAREDPSADINQRQ